VKIRHSKEKTKQKAQSKPWALIGWSIGGGDNPFLVLTIDNSKSKGHK